MKCSRLWIFGMLVGYMASSFDEFKRPGIDELTRISFVCRHHGHALGHTAAADEACAAAWQCCFSTAQHPISSSGTC